MNCACFEGEQNLIAIQIRGMVYYRAYKKIQPGTELLIWYGNQYGEHLGLTDHDHIAGLEEEASM